ncbi:MAG: thioesterase [Actinomycetia bacterium]|nr:thioesterase [Actinomycetes bacterium]
MVDPGITASVSFVADNATTAITLGSGDVAVLGTPKIVALIEEAAVAALSGHLPEGATTVGTHIAVDHLAPTAVGSTVVATATVTEANDRTVSFTATVTEADKVVARGTHTRAIVDRTRFENNVRRTT